MKRKIVLSTILLGVTTSISADGLLKKRVQIHQLQDTINMLLAEIGAENVKDAKRKIRHLNELLGYLQTPNVSQALNKIKKSDAIIYEKEKQNEKLAAQNNKIVAHNQKVIAYADSLESTLKDIIETKNEYEHNYKTHLDIFAKIPEKLPKIRKK